MDAWEFLSVAAEVVLAGSLIAALISRSRIQEKNRRTIVDRDTLALRLKIATSKTARRRKIIGRLVQRVRNQDRIIDTSKASIAKLESTSRTQATEIGVLRTSEAALTASLGVSNNKRDELEEQVRRISQQSNARYTEWISLKKQTVALALELRYWHNFAGRVLHDSKSYFGKVRSFVGRTVGTDDHEMLDNVDFILAVLTMAEAENIQTLLQEMRAATPGPPPFNALPKLRRFVDRWRDVLGSNFRASLPGSDQSLIFLGQWAHLELLFTNMFQNAESHRIPGSTVEFVCEVSEGFGCFTMTNYGEAVDKSITDAFAQSHAGERERFGLYLMEQLACGYDGYIKMANLPDNADPSQDRVQVSVRLPLDG